MNWTEEHLRELFPDEDLDRLLESAGVPGREALDALRECPGKEAVRNGMKGLRGMIRVLMVMRSTDTELPPEVRAMAENLSEMVKVLKR